MPAGALAPLTSIEAPPRLPAAPQPPMPPRFRPRFVAPLVIFVLVLGLGAGWLIRQDSLTLDPAEVQKLAGPSVVRVLATTCEGTGIASGVLLENGLVLTASSAIKQPMSVALQTTTGEVRRANVLGRSQDGVAVLRMIGQLDAPKAQLAPKDPPDAAERAVVAFIANGLQTIQLLGPAKDPKPLSSVLNATKLGAPVLDGSGRVVGLITGDTVPAATVVPVGKLREYASTGQPGITPEPGGGCARSRGPQLPIVPELTVANTPLAGEVQKLLGDYLTMTNRHDFAALRTLYSAQLAKNLPEARDREHHQTSYLFGARIIEVTETGEYVNARMTFTVLFSPNSTGAQGQTCNRLDNRYRLVRERGKLLVDTATAVQRARGCD
ncbi:trypsin-like peptidase domain-containing protein [Kribbella sp. CA-293567]|uniref:trypsin-like peptidase domain-containing protein n=1 Tax=Kribbella sp. CA-293567 TaxID=3002436 RepID=UPI0022DD0D01|nr:trypsin-like peptidase domain-containing protein [Kribbella sp. CA-293567]WBQ07560.1 serine protease [Kribbella sp. CA-293567]